MKDFDSEWAQRRSVENRTFKVCGEEFVMKAAVRPEVFSSYSTEGPAQDQWTTIDTMFLSMIEHKDDAEKRYKELRAADDKLGVTDLREIIDWLVEMQTSRPPTSPSVSSSSRTRTGAR